MALPLFEDDLAEAFVNRTRDEAMAVVADNAEKEREHFHRDACAFVEHYLAQHGAMAAEKLTLACKAAGIVPHDDRAFGPVYMALARQRAIEKVGVTRRERGHGAAGGNIWALASGRNAG